MTGDISSTRVPRLLSEHGHDILESWMRAQHEFGTRRPDLMTEAEMRRQSTEFFEVLREAVTPTTLSTIDDFEHAEPWRPVRDFLSNLSMARARRGFDPQETAMFIMTLKAPLFTKLRELYADEPAELVNESWTVTLLLDKLGLFTTQAYVQSREDIIQRQREEMLELSTPVVEVWDGIMVLPLIGTLDSRRAQQVTEALLQALVDSQAEIAIIDITGVPTVDTLTAQHLIKTVSAARLMGAECIVCGIRPQIAQTMVHLGVSLGNVTTKANLAAALQVAFRRLGLVVAAPQSRRNLPLAGNTTDRSGSTD